MGVFMGKQSLRTHSYAQPFSIYFNLVKEQLELVA